MHLQKHNIRIKISHLKVLVYLIVFGMSGLQFTFSQTALQQAQQLQQSGKETEALTKYLEVLKDDPNNYDALCSTSLLYSRIGNRFTEKAKQTEYFTKAKTYGQKAIDKNPDDDESNYVMATALGRYAIIAPVKEKVSLSHEIKTYVDKALHINPQHGGAWNVLGLWNWGMAKS